MQLYVTLSVVSVVGGAEVWNGEAEERARGEDGRCDTNQGKSAEQREGDCAPATAAITVYTSGQERSKAWGMPHVSDSLSDTLYHLPPLVPPHPPPLCGRRRSKWAAQWQLCRPRRSDWCDPWARRRRSCRLCGRPRKRSSRRFSRSEKGTAGSWENCRASCRRRSGVRAVERSSAVSV